jgi:hypothetical protein
MTGFGHRHGWTLLLERGDEWKPWILTTVIGYLLLCTTLRNRQKRTMETKFKFNGRESLSQMTLQEAHAIQTWLAEQQFPSTFSASLFFALFKVCPDRKPTNRYIQSGPLPQLTTH